MLKGNLVYGQSGGPSPVINASAYGVLSKALKSPSIETVYALKHGISGLLHEDFYDASEMMDLELLIQTPASAFGSVRFKLESHNKDLDTYKKIHNIFVKHNIRYFIYNGGNDSMDTCVKLSNYFDTTDYEVRIVGVPKTIDNDLPFTDHTPGYASSAKYIINTLINIKCDSQVYPKGKVTIVEIMGRHAGWLAASSYVATNEGLGPDLIYLPEHVFDLENFVEEVQSVYSKTNNCLIAVSEGIKNKDRDFIGSLDGTLDAFGHKQLGGVAMYLGNLIEEKLKLSYRVVELSTPQRACTFLRSEVDVVEAIKVGEKAVEFALEGETNIMVGIKRISNEPYLCEYIKIPVELVANKEKEIPASMFTKTGMSQEFYDYIYPLIEGEMPVQFQKGVIKTFKI
jgi:6-phosphofructokinase 1